jgi:hypothetical protein
MAFNFRGLIFHFINLKDLIAILTFFRTLMILKKFVALVLIER